MTRSKRPENIFVNVGAARHEAYRKRAAEMGITLREFVLQSCDIFLQTGQSMQERLTAIEARVKEIEERLSKLEQQ